MRIRFLKNTDSSNYERFTKNFSGAGFFYRFLGLISFLFLLDFSAVAQDSLVGGTITENQTWTNEYTYIVTEDLIVPQNVVLTIQAGVIIKVNFGRGIIIDKGKLSAIGNQSDTIKFLPNYVNSRQKWKWKGLTIKNSRLENSSSIQFSQFAHAETAISIEESSNVTILNSSIVNSQNVGLHLLNSSEVSVLNCGIENNYDGIEILTGPFGESSNNLISNCLIKNQNHNVYVLIEEEGQFKNNAFRENLISSGYNGIWINNSSGIQDARNYIQKNVLINNGANIGYGLFLSLDSTVVAENIFWRNNIAVFTDQKGDNNLFSNNNFYQNNWVFAIGAGSTGNKYLNNTFSLNTGKSFNISETTNTIIRENNILHTNEQSNIVFNNTNRNFSMPDNYWGTTDTAQINGLIYDETDNPVLGKLNYNPYLPSLDTSNPVSAPYQAIKQIVNNKVRISWFANPENDLKGYGIYFGNYSDYNFSENQKIGKDTNFFFQEGISIDDLIAVTAYDSAAIENNAQVSGHESPFAFAQLYPYAGSDTTICSNMDELEITGVTIPFNWQSLFWATSGDGYFDNNEILKPTYYPGELDMQEGSVKISLNVPVGADTLVDSFELYIIDSPSAFAGNDTIVFADSEIELTDASAHNYSSLNWFSDGDGLFENDTIVNTTYFPGIVDNQNGFVTLWMSVYSQCGIAEDSITVKIIPHFSIEGKLWSDERPVNPGVVVAFKENDDGARAVQIDSTSIDGIFKFERLEGGNYYLYAIPDTNTVLNDAPGYYANKLNWQSAYILPVFGDVYDVDIQLPSRDYVLPHGEASITGHMAMPSDARFNSDIYCSPWFGDNSSVYCQDGFSNATVLLFNKEGTMLLDYTLTDNMGNFYFEKLPFGSYIVEAEKVGFQSIPSPMINLSPEHENETGVILEMGLKKIAVYLNQDSPGNSISVYPNPASSEITVPFSNSSSLSSQIKVFGLFGNCVLAIDIPSSNIDTEYKMNIAKLPPGIYFGQVGNSLEVSQFRFVKK